LALAIAAPAGAMAETVTIVTTGKGTAQQWPIFIAMAKGYLAESKIELDVVAVSSAASGIQQLAAGSAHLSAGGVIEPLRAIDKGAAISLLRIETQVPPYALWGKPSIKSIAELRGKLISIGGAKDITRIYLERMLIPNGVKPGDYDTIFAGTTAARFAALAGGAVDAAILVPPFSFKAKGSGFSNLGEVPAYAKGLPFTGQAANTVWAKQHKSVVLGFLNAVARGVDWFNQDANRNEAIDILVKESGSSREDVAMTYDYFRELRIFDRRGLIETSTIGNLIAALKDIGDVAPSAQVGRFIDPEITGLASQVK
jgi:ABC-type nitrate/sulfonate/bicarbonate transport system substrate-binding protein